MIVRRDARQRVRAEGGKNGAGKYRMRFVPVLREFTTGSERYPGCIFGAFVALLQARIGLSGTH